MSLKLLVFGCSALLSLQVIVVLTGPAFAQAHTTFDRHFTPRSLQQVSDVPNGLLHRQLQQLSKQTQLKALTSLQEFHFTRTDWDSLRVDSEGGIYYVDHFNEGRPIAEQSVEMPVSPTNEVALPIAHFPTNLIFHSRLGSPNVLYLNFCGETVTSTAWNKLLQRAAISATSFSLDSDHASFSDQEQLAIKQIWLRVTEDFAPFDFDVTTERPAVFSPRTAHALITRNSDASGQLNSDSMAGGTAYINRFGAADYATYRPVWVYYNNLGGKSEYIAESISHEVGHTLGLSHDGRTDGVEYYKGHGSGDISWGPIMGATWGRNLSQWSKGEYYLANNAQDDLAIIAEKLNWRRDDHADLFASATALVITQGTHISSTTLDLDPHHVSPENKGVLETSTDQDMFSFITGSGDIDLQIKPWIDPNGDTQGGNLDLLVDLYSQTGHFLLSAGATDSTLALIKTNLSDGLYYLRIRNASMGDPLNRQPNGYTGYGCVGQYFISGTVVPSDFVSPPHSSLQVADVMLPGSGPNPITVTYTDNKGIDLSTLDSLDLRITGPNGFSRIGRLLSINPAENLTSVQATYAVDPPDGAVWLEIHGGTYDIWMQSNQVDDLEGLAIPSGWQGQFRVNLLQPIYTASLSEDPQWNLEPLWQYGPPTYRNGGPTSGYTGTNIIAYHLRGNYENWLPPKFAIAPPIDCSGASNLTLRFRRWLQLRAGDTALIQVSTNGADWTDLWSSTHNTYDTAWQEVSYSLPRWTENALALQLRWGISSGATLSAIGWNLDDIEILGLRRDEPVSSVVSFTISSSNPAWGSVRPSNGTCLVGDWVEIAATPAPYFQFVNWTGDVSSASNPLMLHPTANLDIQAVFAELLTTNHPTPCWWLAEQGITNNLEIAVNSYGANGLPIWQSYIAGLDPKNSSSQLRLRATREPLSGHWVLKWSPVAGRFYSIWWSTNILNGFAPVPHASHLPSNVQSFTSSNLNLFPNILFRLEVAKP